MAENKSASLPERGALAGNPPLRVLHVVTAFPRTEDDIITPWLVETLKQLKARGVAVEVFTSSYQGLGDQELFGVPIHRFRYFPRRWENLTHDETTPDRMRKGLLYKFMALTYVLFGWLAIARLCRQRKYDIIHVHWPFPHAVFGAAARRTGKGRLLTSFYGVELRWVKSKLPIFKPFLRWAIKSADRVTAISNYTAQEIRELQPCDPVIIPFGAALREPETPRVLTERAGKMILFVGRLVERKGVRYLIDAIKLLRLKKLDVQLTIVGGGSERSSLAQHAQLLGLTGAVHFAGNVTPEELERCYQQSSIFVLPAVVDSKGDTEGLGVVLLEAMMYRRPVIASQVGGIVDIVRHDQTGILVPEKDAPALAGAIERVLNNPDLAHRLAEGGHEHAQTAFGWPRIIDQLLAVYQGLVK